MNKDIKTGKEKITLFGKIKSMFGKKKAEHKLTSGSRTKKEIMLNRSSRRELEKTRKKMLAKKMRSVNKMCNTTERLKGGLTVKRSKKRLRRQKRKLAKKEKQGRE